MKGPRKTVVIPVLALLLLSLHFFRPGRPERLSVPEGASAAHVAFLLKQHGVIRSTLWFRALVKLTGTGKELMPGDYTLRTHMSSEEVLWKLIHSTYISDVKIVIPEGWRMEQIADRLQANGITKAAEFLALARNEKMEGYLFPSTYRLKKNTPPQEVINLLKSEFDRQVLPLFSKDFPEGLDARKVLIIASIVEREAADPSERSLIAAVYINRYRKGMPLEADPTTQYAVGYNKAYGYWKKALTYKDLKIKSPYNTYVVGGLPPGPICSPGYDSIAATMAPADIDALYFVADGKGRHIFNDSYKEHLKAKRRVEEAEKEERQQQNSH